MSFNIHAAGTGSFRFQKQGIDFGDVYDMAGWHNRLHTIPSGPRALAEAELIDSLTPDDPLQQALNAAGLIEGIHLFEMCITTLLMFKNPVFVSLSARQENTLWADDSTFFGGWLNSQDDQPARYFLHDITPKLDTTGLKTFGVLAAIGQVFAEYNSRGPRGMDRDHRLLIQVSH